MSDETIISYKGFDAQLKCRGFQYEVGSTYHHEGEVAACSSGFHACENPIEVFSYYGPVGNRFACVEQHGAISRHRDDSKIASRTISIKAEIGIPGLVSATFEYIKSKCETSTSEHATGDSSASSATGYSSASSATGYRSASLSTGWNSSSEITPAEKELHAVAISTGKSSKARAPQGSAIVLVYRNDDGELIHIRASKIGENGIKPNVWYSLNESGEFVVAD